MAIAISKPIAVIGSFIIVTFFTTSLSAQITITLPKFPKIKKEKPQPTTPQQPADPPATTKSATPSTPVASDNGATSEVTKGGCEKVGGVTGVHMEDIEKTRKEAEEFRPGLRGWYVSTLNDGKNTHLESALSPSERKDWNLDPNKPDDKCMIDAYDRLAATARKTLPTFTGPTDYTLGTPAEKKALLSGLEDVAVAKVLKVGLKSANWMIAKDSYNYPTVRYKYGMAWVQIRDNDDGFCRVFWINLKQDYAGGGTYGASYGTMIESSYAGCPTLK